MKLLKFKIETSCNHKHRGSGLLVVAIVSAIIVSLTALSVAKVNQLAFSGTVSNKFALQAQQYASAEAELLKVTKYKDLASRAKADVANSDGFKSEIAISGESDYSSTIKQKTATVNIYKGTEALPRASLKVVRLSVDEDSGVPVGTVITWASSKNPTEAGTWLECNGQSCSAYPKLVAVLGKSTVPNYKGVFLRGYGSQKSSHYGTVTHSSGSLGALQGDAIRNISGTFPVPTHHGRWNKYVTGAFWSEGTNTNHGVEGADFQESNKWHDIVYGGMNASRVVPTANEVRPLNVAVRYFIKAA